jgi:putative intracellular protease/amidase
MPGPRRLIALFCAATCLLAATSARAAGKDAAANPKAWKKAETDCLNRCPKPTLTWKAGEKLDAWKKRVAQEREYTACQVQCSKEYARQPNVKKKGAGAARTKRGR